MIFAAKYFYSKHFFWLTLVNNCQETTKQVHSFFFPSNFGHPHQMKKNEKKTPTKPKKQQQHYKETNNKLTLSM